MAEPIVIEHAHSEHGPSAAERWMNCEGSVLYTRGMPGQVSIYAAEGTAAHTLSEWCREQNCSAARFKGQILKVDQYEFKVGKPMIVAVDAFCAYVAALPGIPFFEKRVGYEPWAKGGFGTLDDARVASVCYITDLKFGKGIKVFAAKNVQLMLYALGLYYTYRHLFDFEKFVLAVFQPRLNHIDPWEISLADLLIWADYTVEPCATRTLLPGAVMKAGAWCRFCPGKNGCKTRQNAELGMPLVVAGRRPLKPVDLAEEFENLEELA